MNIIPKDTLANLSNSLDLYWTEHIAKNSVYCEPVQGVTGDTTESIYW